MRGAVQEFTNVTTAEGFGVADDDGYTVYDTAREMMRAMARGGTEFVLCHIDGEQVAEFMDVANERRAKLAACKPASIAAVLFAHVIDPHAAIVDAQLAAGPEHPIERWAFAAAVVARSTGSIDLDQPHYIVKGLGSSFVEVTVHDEYEFLSQRGEAKIL